MTAHDPNGLAHGQQRMSGRPTMINVDKSGVSMSWKTALTVVALIVMGAVAWTVFTATLQTKASAMEHDHAIDAHPVVASEGAAPVAMPRLIQQQVVAQKKIVEKVDTLETKVNVNKDSVSVLRTGFFDQRAEDLAYRALDKMPRTVPTRQRVNEFQRIKKRAKSNLEAKPPRDIRDGLGKELGY